MKRTLKFRPITLASLITGLFLIAYFLVLRPVCDIKPDGTYMSCHNSSIIIMVLAAIIVVLAVVNFFIANKTVSIVSGGISMLILAFIYALINKMIPPAILDFRFCKKEIMPCRGSFFFISNAIPIILIVFTIILIYQILKRD